MGFLNTKRILEQAYSDNEVPQGSKGDYGL